MLASAIGELKTRSEPKSHCKPEVNLKTPPLPLTIFCFKYSSRLQSATSSPKITTRSSRFISSRNVELIKSAIVLAADFFSALEVSLAAREDSAVLDCVSNAGEVGSRAGE